MSDVLPLKMAPTPKYPSGWNEAVENLKKLDLYKVGELSNVTVCYSITIVCYLYWSWAASSYVRTGIGVFWPNSIVFA